MTDRSINPVPCKYCKGIYTVKFGSYNGIPRYWCKDCNRKFKMDTSPFRARVSADVIGNILTMYFNGLRVTDIRTFLKQQTGFSPSRSGIYKWVEKYVDMVNKFLANSTINVSDKWIFDETLLFISNKKVWLLDVIDSKTRYLLATSQTLTMNKKQFNTLLNKATRAAERSPGTIIIHDISAREERHFDLVFKRGMIEPSHENHAHKIERWTPPSSSSPARPRYFINIESATKYNDNYAIHYNYFLSNKALGGRTPAEAAGADYPFKTWAGAIKHIDVCYYHKEQNKPLPVLRP